MAVVVGDKLSGTMMIVLPDKSFFHADCQMVVTGAGTDYGAPPEEPAGTTGATGATGAAATHGAAAHGAAGHHEAKK